MSGAAPIWRSLLFVPAHVERFVGRIHERGADACILDLEDSVPLPHKQVARTMVAPAVAAVAGRGLDVLVRINTLDSGGRADLHAAVCAELRAVVLPKVGTGEDVRAVAALLDGLERERGLAQGKIGLIAQIEDVAALPRLDEIASASPRLFGMSLGPEDFCVSAAMQPTPETLLWPSQQVAFACRRAGILPFGFPASIAEFSDLARLRHAVELAGQLGMVGAFCIHPAQVQVLNQIFTPSSSELEYAEGLLAELVLAEAEGRGAFAYRGRMVDPPVVARARETLQRHLATQRRREAASEH